MALHENKTTTDFLLEKKPLEFFIYFVITPSTGSLAI